MAYTDEQKRQHILELQAYLHGISHQSQLPHRIPDGVYGENTANAVRLFHQQNQLPPTGETDTATWNAIAQAYRQEVRPTVLHLRLFPTGITAYAPGDKGSAVFVIQGVLQAIHSAFPAVPQVQSSGVYDTATKNAVQQFQELTPLPPSGTVDAATWNHLLAALRP